MDPALKALELITEAKALLDAEFAAFMRLSLPTKEEDRRADFIAAASDGVDEAFAALKKMEAK